MSRRPEAIALEELVAAVEGWGEAYLLLEDPAQPVPEAVDARLTMALNAARNALHMGRVLDGTAADPDIARGHVGSVG